jgi:hypothetical protein
VTYADDIQSDDVDISYRIRFAGIEQPLSQRVLSGHLAALVDVSAGEARLDRRRSVVRPAGFSAQLLASDDVLAYFSRRGGVETLLPVALDRVPTTVTVTPNAYADGQTIYVDRETIVLGTETGMGTGVYAGCTRGAFGSVAAAHPINAIASSKPRYWRRRPAYLEAISHPSGSIGGVLGGVLSESPEVIDPGLRLEFLDVMTELNRPVCTGWNSSTVESVTAGSPLGAGWTIKVADIRRFKSTNSSKGFIRIRRSGSEGDFAIYDMQDALAINVADREIYLRAGRLVAATVPVDDMRSDPLEAQMVLMLYGDPSQVALQLMLSDLGSGSGFDVLPGTDPQGVDVPRQRMGAGLTSAQVDVDGWRNEINQEPVPGRPNTFTPVQPMRLLIDEETRLIDVLSQEILWRIGGYVYADNQGRLALQKYEAATPSGNLPLFDADSYGQAAIRYRDDESEVISRVSFESAYDYAQRSFRRRDDVLFGESSRIYGEETSSASFAAKSLVVGEVLPSPLSSPPMPVYALELAADRMASRTLRGVERFPVRLPWRYSGLGIGGRLLVTDARMPNGTGGRGFTEVQAEVIGEKWDLPQVEKQLLLEVLKRGWLIAPSAMVLAGSTTTVLNLSGALAIDSDTPARDFAVGWRVQVYSSDATFATVNLRTIDAVTDTAITLGDALTFTPTTSTIVVLANASSAALNQWGAGVYDHAFLADDDDEVEDVSGDPVEVARWQ